MNKKEIEQKVMKIIENQREIDTLLNEVMRFLLPNPNSTNVER